jgi:DNA-binding PadR family transcriptional regulator
MASRFLTKQRAVLKLYLLNLAEQKRLYGLQFKDIIQKQFQKHGYIPSHSEIYKALYELTEDGILKRIKQPVEEGGFQEVVIYQFTEEGLKMAKAYKKLVKEDLERSRRLIDKIMKDNF